MVPRLRQEHVLERRHADHACEFEHAHVIRVPCAWAAPPLAVQLTQEENFFFHASTLEVGGECEDKPFGV